MPNHDAAATSGPLRLLPGLALCVAVTLVASLLQLLETRLAGEPYLEALVLAIVLGVVIRTAWTPGPRWRPGIRFSAKILLEIAVVLLGASVSAATVLALGPALIAGIAGVVALALATSYAIGRLLGLPQRMAILVACGNSICGNSAIAAVAPVIGADGDDIASSIAFTAVLGVVVVLGLPLLVPLLRMSLTQYGVLAGLTVYAVPQVLAATLPIGALSNQVGHGGQAGPRPDAGAGRARPLPGDKPPSRRARGRRCRDGRRPSAARPAGSARTRALVHHRLPPRRRGALVRPHSDGGEAAPRDGRRACSRPSRWRRSGSASTCAWWPGPGAGSRRPSAPRW